jgi:hypothetical protein
MTDESKATLLSPSTYLPIGAVFAAVGFTVLVMSKLNEIQTSILETRTQLALMDARVAGHWSAANMDSWIDKTKIRNPALSLPAVEEIKRGH